ncbi:hypothetical protein [Magnetospirillum sp. UT-4]|uniref:hypothetical protein n=1 Tax=Magnetospirillum sp. UT-4 TaxID=2681467 RepID=UPI00137C957A|nr:hypothetical protein [Magnetospirillum sp. UT-4]CAA7614258.1 conserved hypothetical protein [Magnetospirillum sp. UT-4]
MGNVNWNDGRLVTLNPGDNATCSGGLNSGQLYALFFYNSANNDASTTVSVVWSNSNPPVTLTVPGTTANQGLAALCFVSGDDTNTVSVAVGTATSGQIQAFIGSVKMPTNTSGMNNTALPIDGKYHDFAKFTRFYAVPASHWYTGTLNSNINQFISVQFKETSAVVNILNQLVDPSNVIKYAGNCDAQVKINSVTNQTYSWNFQGNGNQWVWINADSCQNTQTAKIALQSLSGVYAEFVA